MACGAVERRGWMHHFWPPKRKDGCVSLPVVPLGLEELRSKVRIQQKYMLTISFKDHRQICYTNAMISAKVKSPTLDGDRPD